MDVGFVGLGKMGRGMAASLLRHGHRLSIYNRTPGKGEDLVRAGAKPVTRVGDACQGEVVFTMLADDRALESVVYQDHGILGSLQKSALHISSSTISVALAERLSVDHAELGQRFVSATVFGLPDVAAAGALSVVAAGGPNALDLATPLLESVGKKVFFLPGMPRNANLVKLSGNFLIAAAIEAIGEALALIAKGGIAEDEYLKIITTALFDLPIYKNYGAAIATRKFEPAKFTALLARKDIRLALAAAYELQVALPLCDLLHRRFLTLLANGGENLDWSAIGSLAAKDAGLP
jgi:3-hydroxyisobutyrate dehydrogenase-like beta-hydroxyacid dehydrogenase